MDKKSALIGAGLAVAIVAGGFAVASAAGEVTFSHTAEATQQALPSATLKADALANFTPALVSKAQWPHGFNMAYAGTYADRPSLGAAYVVKASAKHAGMFDAYLITQD